MHDSPDFVDQVTAIVEREREASKTGLYGDIFHLIRFYRYGFHLHSLVDLTETDEENDWIF